MDEEPFLTSAHAAGLKAEAALRVKPGYLVDLPAEAAARDVAYADDAALSA